MSTLKERARAADGMLPLDSRRALLSGDAYHFTPEVLKDGL